MRTRLDAAKSLWRDWKDAAARWWMIKSAGDFKDQTSTWLAAVGIPAALLGLVLCPRLTVLACAGVYIWSKIEERR
jgi:hypothetical protein